MSLGVDRRTGRRNAPWLRNVAMTAPYMHDGSKQSLAEVIEVYDRGGQANPALDPLIRPLHLTLDEKHALVAFLEALTTRRELGTR